MLNVGRIGRRAVRRAGGDGQLKTPTSDKD